MVISQWIRKQSTSPVLRLFMDYIYVLIGSAFVGIAFNVFLLPNRVASGGVSGISTIVHWTLGWEASYVQWALNIPLFVLGVALLGSTFGYLQYALKTLVGTIFLPFIVYITSGWDAATHHELLGALFGGIGVGLGLGIVFRGNASTGGTDLAAQVIHKYTGISLGTCVACIDGLIVISSAVYLSIESALFALIGMYLTGKLIDVVQMGFNTSKLVYIISDQQTTLRSVILTEIDRGITRIDAHGGFTENKRPMLMCAVSQSEITKLKHTVKAVDPTAFMIVTNAVEIVGEGFEE
ncbi:YitT family protein [Tuberibacillus sp. Marseille-P3662]|uniref:YitT family protein n=1 Tax=Tuberibacillus sp. Marseille-P3662 TaxID=1965358 RepID=UPI000A1CD28C|nr:YitT family protein [Tuberibacillus sp. Marseille-P3662]